MSRTGNETIRQLRREYAGKHELRCRKCWRRPARHKMVTDGWMCCECYVAAGYKPAEWHRECMAAYAIRKTWR
jgi:hypothetical protein